MRFPLMQVCAKSFSLTAFCCLLRRGLHPLTAFQVSFATYSSEANNKSVITQGLLSSENGEFSSHFDHSLRGAELPKSLLCQTERKLYVICSEHSNIVGKGYYKYL